MKPTIKKVPVTSYIYEVTDCEGYKRTYDEQYEAEDHFEAELQSFNIAKQLKKKGVTLLALKERRLACGNMPSLIGFNGVPYSSAYLCPKTGYVWPHLHPLEEYDYFISCPVRSRVNAPIKDALKQLYVLLTHVGRVELHRGAYHIKWDPAVGDYSSVYEVWEGLEEGFWWWNYDGKRFTTNYPNKFELKARQ